MIKHWNRLPREAVNSSLKTSPKSLKGWKDKSLYNNIQVWNMSSFYWSRTDVSRAPSELELQFCVPPKKEGKSGETFQMEEAAPVYWKQLNFERRFKKSQQSGADRINRHEADEDSFTPPAPQLRCWED